jgi:hypothetical protein
MDDVDILGESEYCCGISDFTVDSTLFIGGFIIHTHLQLTFSD